MVGVVTWGRGQGWGGHAHSGTARAELRERRDPQKPPMELLPAAVSALHLLVLLLLFLATLGKGWWVLPDSQALNLWLDCAPQNLTRGWECRSLGLSPLLRGVQGLMVTALLLSAFGLLLFLGQLLGGPRGRLFLPAAAAQLLAGISALMGAGLFLASGDHPGDLSDHPGVLGGHPGVLGDHPGVLGGHPGVLGGRPGHCPVLAGLGGALALVSGGGYLRLRGRG
nr:epithelial membrane protein 3-like [Taeniopygia guttata]